MVLDQRLNRLAITPNEVHVWLADPKCVTATFQQGHQSILGSEERTRADQFVFDLDRRIFIAAHVLLRTALSRHADVPPQCWEFRTDRSGCPEIAGPEGTQTLRFSLSHTHGLVACVVALEIDVGIDVEQKREVDSLSLASRFFSHEENSLLETLTSEQRLDQFFTYWTLKEAFMKALGEGLSLGLDQLCFTLGPTIGVRIDPKLREQASNWQFAAWRPTDKHWLAIALRKPRDGSELKIVTHSGLADILSRVLKY